MNSNTRICPVTLLPLAVFLASAWLAGLVFYPELLTEFQRIGAIH